MNKKINSYQALFMVFFVMVVLAIFEFVVPDFQFKSVVFILLCGLSAWLGGMLSVVLLKEKIK
ncbi:hypothetical protein [Gracilibacillus saliphilus]|uniref:hypothetical protein n=1 Tax=Gracilibacillus saliphilus TaxID=543890 RepID=UPI001EE23BD9|nr:hypothetical protein [Gracilibacillus saliphilus]